MKKTFFRMLPFVAAVVLAASCGKDGDSDVNISEPEPIATPENTETVSGNGFVEIPFSIKVNDGKSLSKVALSIDGTTKSINFESTDVWNESEGKGVQLTVTGDGVSGTLNLVNVGGYKFDGKLSVEEGKQGAFSTGEGIDLVGTFTQDKGTQTTSTISFEDLWNHCVHTYKAEFKSTASSLELVDQNLYFYVATYKEAITINGSSVVADKGFLKGSYYAYPYATTTVAGFDAGKTIAPSKLYTIGKAVTSVTINGAPTETKYWGNDAFTLTASVEPSGVTNPDVTWTVVQGSATLTESGDNNSSCSVLIKGNSADLKIKATVDEVVSEVTIVVDPDYVDLGTGEVYWKTSDESESYNWTTAKSMGAPEKDDFDLLWTSSNVSVSGFTFTNNKNGSDASITLQSGWYWSSTQEGASNGCSVSVNLGGRDWANLPKSIERHVRLVRAQ